MKRLDTRNVGHENDMLYVSNAVAVADGDFGRLGG
jgi:hypothetical protein